MIKPDFALPFMPLLLHSSPDIRCFLALPVPKRPRFPAGTRPCRAAPAELLLFRLSALRGGAALLLRQGRRALVGLPGATEDCLMSN